MIRTSRSLIARRRPLAAANSSSPYCTATAACSASLSRVPLSGRPTASWLTNPPRRTGVLTSHLSASVRRHYYPSLPKYSSSSGDGSGDEEGSGSDDGDEEADGAGEEGGSGGRGANGGGGGSGSGVLVIPSKLAFGESAPRFPHMQALPLVSRPLFPGLVTTVTLTDPATIDALDALQNKRESAYISCFLRKKHSTGVSEGGVILSTPEVITSPDDIYHTGSFAQIQRLTRNVAGPKPADLSDPEGGGSAGGGAPSEGDDQAASSSAATLLLLAHRRVDLKSLDDVGPPIDVTVRHWPRTEYTGTNDSIRALSNEILSTIREIAQISALFRESLQFYPVRIDANDPYRLADFTASISSSGTPDDLQAILEERDPEQRLHKALVLLNREKQVAVLQQEISKKVEEKMTEQQRKYFLNEQYKMIKKELGLERDDKEALIEKYKSQLASYPSVPDDVMEVIQQELDKFSTLEKNSPEFNVTRSYLDWLIGVPWGVSTEENFDLALARKTLDRDHYGLDDVKDTILEFIAVGKLKGTVQGKILCLAGPPGTGKTSIARSVAESLGREFYRFSVGGLSDVSEIKGHRRTYIGAMPGKIIQCLKAAKTMNPVVLIDEIDKLGTGFRGDPAAALLEVLDPSQNSTFRDHFLDVPVDISKALFLCTANELERIPGPLLDRMEVIRLSGYDFPEKVTIAEQYLVPKSMRDSGLMIDPSQETGTKFDKPDAAAAESDETPDPEIVVPDGTPLDKFHHSPGVPETLRITDEAVKSLVRWYAREAGVRNLAKYIDKITRKLALQVVASQEGTDLREKSRRKSDTWVVDTDNLSDYVGKPRFTSDRLYEVGPLPPGIVMGLAYTSMGGSALYIETQGIKRGVDSEGKTRGGGSLKVTGQLGDVMKESTQIAYTLARAILHGVDPSNEYFDTMDIHTHVPEGATPKDGPSAGITIVTSMLSLAMDKPIRNDLAMTGEVSLTGKVLAVGGIKEKVMAARRAGIKCLVLPASNQRDFDEIPDYLKEDLEVHYAEDYTKVYDVAFNLEEP